MFALVRETNRGASGVASFRFSDSSCDSRRARVRLSGVSQLYLAPSWPFLRRAETNCLSCVKCCEHIAPPPSPRLDLNLCWSGGCRVAPSAEYLAKQSAEAPPERLLLLLLHCCCYCSFYTLRCCCCCRRAAPQSDDIICGPREIYLCLCASLCLCVCVCACESVVYV